MAAEYGPLIDVSADEPTLHGLSAPDVAALADELAAYHARFAPYFARREPRAWAAVYLRGLLIADVPRKNTEAMALRLLGADDGAEARVRALQQFIGEGGWDDDAILAAHRRLVDETLGEADGVLIVDESAIAKRGDHSAGAARQWCGSTGKSDLCQAGVFLGYASRKGYTLLDRHLYLPKEWFAADHRERWAACRIPKDTPLASKTELAGRMVEAAVTGGLRAQWLACDEWYGRDSAFLDQVAGTGLWYLAEVSKHTLVWPLLDLVTSEPQVPPQTWTPPRNASGKGRTPVRVRLQPDSPSPLRIDALAAQLPATAWRRYRVLEGSRGPLTADFATLRAVAVRDGLPGPAVWVLLRRPLVELGERPELKYFLAHAPADTPLATLVRVSGLRWPIESCFGESKEEVGLDQYELRFWRGWQHHMTLVILAHHFLVRLRLRLQQRGGGANSNRPEKRRRTRWPVWTGCRRPPCPRRSHRSHPAPRPCRRCAGCSAPPCPSRSSRHGWRWPSWRTGSATTLPPTARTANAPSNAWQREVHSPCLVVVLVDFHHSLPNRCCHGHRPPLLPSRRHPRCIATRRMLPAG